MADKFKVRHAVITSVIANGKADHFRDKNTGELLFVVSPSGMFDHRKKAPFSQIIPCPFCGTDNDSKHDRSKHIDTHNSVIVVWP